VSHDSGFRQGGSDFTHRQNRRSVPKGRTARQLEQRMKRRFRAHEQKTNPQRADEETPEA